MGKILQISIYAVSLILVFLFFSTLLKSCSKATGDSLADTTQRVADNIESAGGEIVAKAESALDEIGEEFEGEDVKVSTSSSESKSYNAGSKKPDPVERNPTKVTEVVEEDYEPSYVIEDTPAPVSAPPVKKETVAPVKKASSSSAGNSSGRYLLITGNYSQEFNAAAMVKKLKNKGFSNAEFVIFEGSRYYTALAGKYSSMEAANAAKRDLGEIDAYVQKRRD